VTAAIWTTLVGRHKMHVGLKRVQDTNKDVDQRLGCHSRGDIVNVAMYTVTTFAALAWVYFSLAFSMVFEVFLTKLFTNSGYKTPIRNMDEVFPSGINLAYPPE